METMTTGRRTFALYGAAATAVGLAVGDLVATVVAPAASPVLTVGSALIDLAPRAVKTTVIDWFGAADKPILVTLVVLGALGLGAIAGAISRDRPAVGVAVLGGLTALVVALIATEPTLGTYGFLPAIATGGLAIVVLLLLRRWRLAAAASGPATDGSVTRRSVLTSVGLVVVAAATAVGSRGLRSGAVPTPTLALPNPVKPVAPLPRGLSASGITPLRTPIADFYRVDTRLRVPSVDAADWRLTIDGDVDRQVHVTYAQLLDMPLIERDITLVCVSNPTGGPYAGGARWLGVRLTDLLERAGRGSGKAEQILSTDVGGMTISTPLDAATDGRDSMIAVGMNGRPLPPEHGYPARLIVPGLYGFIGATKWIRRMTLTTYAAQEAYWTPRGWATEAPIKLASRIDTPRDGRDLDAGEVIVGGIAWAHANGGVAAVQVRIDDQPWKDATLGPSGGSDYWRQWFFRWDAPRGEHTLRVRTIGADGRVQTAKRADIAPDGADGHHSVTVSVS
jgi:DMSO/TMAO reductase YedYZ molybdopterin-dependent catalytic subunit